MSEADPHDAKASERLHWTAAAPAWDRWADGLAGFADNLNLPLLDAAGVAAGERVLDLACGAGEPALSAARRTGPAGLVAALDLVPAMLKATRRRAAAAGLGVTTLAGDMEALPFAAASFHRVTCRFGLMFCPDPVRALREIGRVLRSGGTAGIMVWGPKHDNTLFAVLTAALERLRAPPAEDMPDPFCFAAEGGLAAVMAEAGFIAPLTQTLRFSRRVALDPPPGKPPFWQATLEMLPTTGLAGLAKSERETVAQAVRAGFAERSAGGEVQLEGMVRLGIARHA